MIWTILFVAIGFISVLAFIAGFGEGWDKCKQRWAWKRDGHSPFWEGVSNGMCYAIFWPLIVIVVVIVLWDERRNGKII